MSKIRTYSKNQKVVDCPAIFSSVTNKMDISSDIEQEIVKTKTTTKRVTKKEQQTKKIDDEVEVLTEVAETSNKRNTRTRKQVSKAVTEEPVVVPSKTLSKRRGKNENKENKSEDVTNVNNKQKTVKLFQNSNSDMDDSEDQDFLQPPPVPEKKERGRPSTKGKQTLRSASSASNIVAQPKRTSTARTSAQTKKTLIKSSSVSQMNKIETTNHLIVSESMDLDDSSVSKSKGLKSIMKTSKSEANDIEEDVESLKTKRAVRILETIDDKNDQIPNLRIDNKTKHTTSTSTPTVRRRPLKSPQDISIIFKSE